MRKPQFLSVRCEFSLVIVVARHGSLNRLPTDQLVVKNADVVGHFLIKSVKGPSRDLDYNAYFHQNENQI